MYTQKIGRFGEDIAEKYLKQKGYKIIDRNFTCKFGEIDIIALKRSEIIFIEIKTRVSKKYGMPSEAVTSYKLDKILKTAQYYLYVKNLVDKKTRIDVIEIYIKNNKIIVNHLKQVV